MALINSLVSWLNTKRLSQIDFFKNHPIEIQKETLTQLIEQASNTEWGKKYDFRSIHSLSTFKERLPIQTYEDIEIYIRRLRRGEQNIFWPSEIKWFAKSSGTTNSKSKFIPVSKEALEDCHFRGGKDILAIYTDLFPETGILKGKGLTLGGSHQINNINNDSYYGDLSAILIQNLPFWADFIRTPDTSIVLMEEWEEKMEKMTEATLGENVTSLSGVPSWFLVLLKHILKVSGKSNILEIWPNLELFVHGGVNFSPYREQFKQLLPSKEVNYLETYNASEGFFGIQNNPLDDSMLLMLDYGIYYEFIPIDCLGTDEPKAISLEDVKLYTNYAILITTNGGLWRYQIGDTVQFTSKEPFKFKISGRTKLFINAFGEELIIDNAEKAIQTACVKTNSVIKEYTAAPIFMDSNRKGSHQWLIEFEKSPQNIDEFTFILDNALMSLNSDYEAKRYKNITLEKPLISIAKAGLFYQWLKEKGKLGGQNKVPRLSNNRTIIEELLKINN
ncbi:GH3 auxin-responsive promoter family protein [Labilibaculum sp.]|uniref:GH3 auxin-responsive promoter family protein n=1 Tax=Labilibaculum sp. TaxID=2060723 RepID=UPI00356AE130